MDSGDYNIGRLRWRVTIARRRQSPAPDNTIAERYEPLARASADIQPLGGLTFWTSAQTETPVTHHIVLRWVDYLDNTHVVLRTSQRPDGELRSEVFRVRRVSDMDGRKRFTVLDVELEVVA